MMMRAKYTKTGNLAYLSHLDLVRLFERAFRRAAIPISFTQGFNPHPVIAFAAPLSVGVSSTAEYLDVLLNEPMDPADFLTQMNNTLPAGIQILEALPVDQKSTPSLMQEAVLMDYRLQFRLQTSLSEQELAERIHRFLQEDRIMILRKANTARSRNRPGKHRKQKPLDIRPLIHDFRMIQHQPEFTELKLTLHVINQGTVKPILVLEAWMKECSLSIQPSTLFIERKEIYKRDAHRAYVSMMAKPDE